MDTIKKPGISQRAPVKLQRVPATDMSAAEEVFKAAMVLIVPEDQTQRKAFESLLPYMYVLRNKGCSWAQLTNLLTECGFALQPSTVRTYYSEMLATRLDICQARMNEQISVFETIRKETSGAELSAIAGRVSAVMDEQRSMASAKIDALFGPTGKPSPPAHAPVRATAPRQEPKNSGSDPGRTQQNPEEPAEAGSFGLLGLPARSQKSANTPAGFFNVDDAPPVPNLTKVKTEMDRRPAPPSQPVVNRETRNPRYRCSRLQEDVIPLKKRENIAAEVYQPGELEHPAIPGLVLSLDQRLYGAALEYADEETGELMIETTDQKRFRVTWRKPVPMTQTMTGDSFTKMDDSLFPGSIQQPRQHV